MLGCRSNGDASSLHVSVTPFRYLISVTGTTLLLTRARTANADECPFRRLSAFFSISPLFRVSLHPNARKVYSTRSPQLPSRSSSYGETRVCKSGRPQARGGKQLSVVGLSHRFCFVFGFSVRAFVYASVRSCAGHRLLVARLCIWSCLERQTFLECSVIKRAEPRVFDVTYSRLCLMYIWNAGSCLFFTGVAFSGEVSLLIPCVLRVQRRLRCVLWWLTL